MQGLVLSYVVRNPGDIISIDKLRDLKLDVLFVREFPCNAYIDVDRILPYHGIVLF